MRRQHQAIAGFKASPIAPAKYAAYCDEKWYFSLYTLMSAITGSQLSAHTHGLGDMNTTPAAAADAACGASFSVVSSSAAGMLHA